MYTIYADDTPVYVPNEIDEGYICLDPCLTLEANQSGSLTFTIPTTNKMYDGFQKLKTHVSVLQDGSEIWYGRVLETQRDFYNRKQITCEGMLSFLSDTIIRPFEKTSMTIVDFFREIIAQHNEQASTENQLTCGNISISDYTDAVEWTNDAYTQTWDLIQNDMVSVYGGYLFTRTTRGIHYIDYVDETFLLKHHKNSQTISFGENLLDLTEYITAEDVVTVLIPLGDIQTSTTTTDEEETATDIEYTDSNRVNIKSVNDDKDYIENTSGVELFGKVWGSKIYDGVTDPAKLLSKAKADLKTIVKLTTTMDISAVDLADAGVDVTRLKYGYMTNVVSVPHNVNDWYLLSTVKLYLTQPDSSLYTLGQSSTSLTDSIVKTTKTAKSTATSVKTIKGTK